MKSIEKNKAINLRKQGKSIKDIAKELNVSSSSVSNWVREVELTDEQIEALRQQNPIINIQLRGNNCIKETAKKQRENFQLEGKNIAKQNIPLHMAGCMLYWAEGSKDRNSCTFSNSDQNMLKFFLTFLYECYNLKVSDIKIHITCNTDNGLTVEDIEKYWSETLGIPFAQFTKTTTNILSKYSFKKKAKNKLLYGTVQLRVHSTKLVQNIFGAIQEYAKFEYQPWLE